MASAQVYRFQRRLNTLQTHHELSLKRHSVSNKCYETRSREVMNSLISHLSESEKRLKKTKRAAKPKLPHSQVHKQNRCNDSKNSTSNYFSYAESSRYSCHTDQMNACSMTQPGGREHLPFHFGENLCHNNYTNEPIFPPPTYADPSRSPTPSSRPMASRNNAPIENYTTSKMRGNKSWIGSSNHTDPYHSHPSTYPFGMYSEEPFTPSQPPCYEVPATQHDPSSLFASVYSVPTTRPWSRFFDSQTDFIPSHESYPNDLTPSRQSLRSPVVPKYESLQQKQQSYGMQNAPYDRSVCGETTCSANDLSIFPRLQNSVYPGINPILASTYPLGPTYRTNEAYRSPSAVANYQATTQFSAYNFAPLSVNTDTVQYGTKLPDLVGSHSEYSYT